MPAARSRAENDNGLCKHNASAIKPVPEHPPLLKQSLVAQTAAGREVHQGSEAPFAATTRCERAEPVRRWSESAAPRSRGREGWRHLCSVGKTHGGQLSLSIREFVPPNHHDHGFLYYERVTPLPSSPIVSAIRELNACIAAGCVISEHGVVFSAQVSSANYH